MLDHRNLTSGSVHSHTVKAYSYSDLALAMIAMLNNPVYILHLSSERSWHERRGFSSWYMYENNSSSATENTQPLTNWNNSNIFFCWTWCKKTCYRFLHVVLHPQPLSLPPSIIHPPCHLKLSIKTIQTCMLKKNYIYVTFPTWNSSSLLNLLQNTEGLTQCVF